MNASDGTPRRAIMYYHTNSMGPDIDALKAGFKKCGDLAQKRGVTQAGLAVPIKSTLDGVISGVLGDEAVGLLQRNRVLDLNGFYIHLITKRVTPRRFSGPVLAVYTTIEQIVTIANSSYCKGLIYVPWAEDELGQFCRRYQSEEIPYVTKGGIGNGIDD